MEGVFLPNKLQILLSTANFLITVRGIVVVGHLFKLSLSDTFIVYFIEILHNYLMQEE